jgi:hypothetical protein
MHLLLDNGICNTSRPGRPGVDRTENEIRDHRVARLLGEKWPMHRNHQRRQSGKILRMAEKCWSTIWNNFYFSS